MKFKVYVAALFLVCAGYSNSSQAQANTTLSNLVSPTSVNQALIPSSNNTRDLGSTTRRWRSFYLDSNIYFKNVLTFHAPATDNLYFGPNAGNPAAAASSGNSGFGGYALDKITGGDNNTGIGFRALNTLTTGGSNTAVGNRALYGTTSASYNTAMGYKSLYANTTGTLNTAIGYQSLQASTTAGENATLGANSLFANTTGSRNAGLGAYNLYSNTSGTGNTATGYYTLYTNSTGSYNTANGYYALIANGSGNYNTATGYGALYSNTTSYSTAYGSFALYSNTSGAYNTATGYAALYLNTTGTRNSALGHYALEVNTTGNDNTAKGYYALQSNSTGVSNTATGSQALYNSTTGGYNTANGAQALYSTSTGSYNTATGYYSLRANTTGASSAAYGYYALYSNTTGLGNTGIGSYSLESNTSGDYNAALGRFSLSLNTTGNYNTAVGYSADVNAGGYTNATVVGYNATATASNQVRIGNSSVTSIGGYANWSNISDGRFKKNVKENVSGLNFINKLKPVTYNLDIKGLNARITPGNKSVSDDKTNAENRMIEEKEKEIYSGFVAQDVEKAAKETGYVFSGIDAPKNDKDVYGLRYADFVVPLVKAVQELSQQNEAMKNEIAELKAMISKGAVSGVVLSNASLAQNTPNPFKGSTTIGYNMPQKFTTAQLIVYDATGKALKQINITSPGKGSVKLDAATLAAGAYNYSLMVDGKLVDTKKMVLAK